MPIYWSCSETVCATKLHILNIHQLKMPLPTPADLSNFAFNFKNQLKWSLSRKAFPWPQVHLLNTSNRSHSFCCISIVYYCLLCYIKYEYITITCLYFSSSSSPLHSWYIWCLAHREFPICISLINCYFTVFYTYYKN